MQLSDYATIRTGLVLARKKTKQPCQEHQYKALSLKNVSNDGKIILDSIEDYSAVESLKNEYFTSNGDILIRLTSPYTPIFITDNEKDLLVSSHFAIIRVNENVDATYLYWWFTQNKQQFYKFSSGSSILGTISSGYIADMPFNPPPLSKQKQIGQLLQLANREQELLLKLSEKRKDFMNQILIQRFRLGEQ